MKRWTLFFLLASIAVCTATTVVFDFRLFTTRVFDLTNRWVTVTPLSAPISDGAAIISRDAVKFRLNTNASFTTNLQAGDYTVELDGPQIISKFTIAVLDTNITVQARDIITSSTNLSAGRTAWAAVSSDLRYVRHTNGVVYTPTNFWAPGTNVIAGTNVHLSWVSNNSKLQINLASLAGEANEGANVGGGTNIYIGKTNTTLAFRTILPTNGIVIHQSNHFLILGATNVGGASSSSATNNVEFGTTNIGMVPLTVTSLPGQSNLIMDVQWTNGSSALSVNSNGFVGIGTNYPSSRLSVHGNARIASNMLVSKTVVALSNLVTGGIEITPLTPSRALLLNSSAQVDVGNVTDVQLSYLSNVTSDVQNQLNLKQPTNAHLTQLSISGTNRFMQTNHFGQAIDVSVPATSTQVLMMTNNAWRPMTLPTGATGEANDGENIGTGAGVFSAKSGVNLQFRSLVASNLSLSIVTNASNIFLEVKGLQATNEYLTDLSDGSLSGIYVQANSSANYGVVGPGALSPSMVWKTDAGGNPDWRADDTGGSGTATNYLTNTVYFAVVPGGGSGTGTALDPYNAWGSNNMIAAFNFDTNMNRLTESNILGTTRIHVILAPGTYYTAGWYPGFVHPYRTTNSKPWQLKTGLRLSGSGMGRTYLVSWMTNENIAINPGSSWYHLLLSSDTPVDDVTIEDMTLDCGATNMTLTDFYKTNATAGVTASAISLSGNNITLQRLHIINFGAVGFAPAKGYVVDIAGSAVTNRAAVIQGCRASDPYYSLHPNGVVVFNVTGQTVPGVFHGALIANNWLKMSNTNGMGSNQITAFQVKGTRGAQVINNFVDGCFYGLTHHSGYNYDMVVRNNTFRDVRFGFQMGVPAGGASIGYLDLSDNIFLLWPCVAPYTTPACAVQILSDSATTPVITNFVFRNNYIGYGSVSAEGVTNSMVLATTNLGAVLIENNRIEAGWTHARPFQAFSNTIELVVRDNYKFNSTNLPVWNGVQNVDQTGRGTMATNLINARAYNAAANTVPLIALATNGHATNIFEAMSNGVIMASISSNGTFTSFAGSDGAISLYESDGSNYLTLTVPDGYKGTTTMRLSPTNLPLHNSVLTFITNASGGYWTNQELDLGGGGGGSSGQIQYNSGGALAGIPGFVYDVANDTVLGTNAAFINLTNDGWLTVNVDNATNIAANQALIATNGVLAVVTNYGTTLTNNVLTVVTNYGTTLTNNTLTVVTNYGTTLTNNTLTVVTNYGTTLTNNTLTVVTNYGTTLTNNTLTVVTNYGTTLTNNVLAVTTNSIWQTLTTSVYRTIWIGAGAMRTNSASTGAPASGTHEQGVQGFAIPYDVWDFDGSTIETNWFALTLPQEWDAGTIKTRIHWTETATNSGAVAWGISVASFAAGDLVTNYTLLGTEQLCLSTNISTNQLAVATNATALTIGNTPAAGDLILFMLRRKTDDAGDTMATCDARLLGVEVQYRINKQSGSSY